MQFDASQLRQLGVELGIHASNVPNKARVVVKKTAKDIEATAKKLAPVDTGNLRSSITTSDLRGVSRNSLSAEVRASASYSVYLEMGTSRMAPQPFMRPAADTHEPAFMAAMEKIIGDFK